jgi:hypothetical protein
LKKSGNAFERLSVLAARERWCWNLCCTTCGHMVFRWGLKAIANGFDPDDPDWPVHWGKRETSSTLTTRNGPMPPAGGWPLAEQCAIQEAAQDCLIGNIAAKVPFPDWLGHLGVLLRYTEDAERNNPALTQRFVPQLLDLIEQPSAAESTLRQRLEARDPLRWHDLELVEHYYRAPRRLSDIGDDQGLTNG